MRSAAALLHSFLLHGLILNNNPRNCFLLDKWALRYYAFPCVLLELLCGFVLFYLIFVLDFAICVFLWQLLLHDWLLFLLQNWLASLLNVHVNHWVYHLFDVLPGLSRNFDVRHPETLSFFLSLYFAYLTIVQVDFVADQEQKTVSSFILVVEFDP